MQKIVEDCSSMHITPYVITSCGYDWQHVSCVRIDANSIVYILQLYSYQSPKCRKILRLPSSSKCCVRVRCLTESNIRNPPIGGACTTVLFLSSTTTLSLLSFIKNLPQCRLDQHLSRSYCWCCWKCLCVRHGSQWASVFRVTLASPLRWMIDQGGSWKFMSHVSVTKQLQAFHWLDCRQVPNKAHGCVAKRSQCA